MYHITILKQSLSHLLRLLIAPLIAFFNAQNIVSKGLSAREGVINNHDLLVITLVSEIYLTAICDDIIMSRRRDYYAFERKR